MKAEDHIYQLFAEADPAPVSAVVQMDRPDADTLLREGRRPTLLTQEPKILEPRRAGPRFRRWGGPAVALASFVVAVLAVGGAIWLARSGEDDPVATEPTIPPVTTTAAPSSTTTSTRPPIVVAVPDLRGLALTDARAAVEAAGLLLVVTVGAPDDAVVTAQDPEPGFEVTLETVITVDASPTPACSPTVRAAPQPGQVEIFILFECGNETGFPSVGIPLHRLVPEGGGEAIDRIEWTLRTLLAGPSSEERSVGFASFFDFSTAEAFNSVTLEDGHVVADFNDAIYVNNANTSTGALFFNAELRSNLFQHPEVDSVEFRINGDCEAWSAYFESDGCWIITRADWNAQLAEWDELRSQ